MKQFVRKMIVTGLGLWAADALLAGITTDGVGSLLLTAGLLGFVNAVVRPVVVLFTLPITFVTLGLFLLVINGMMLMLASRFVDGVQVSGIVPATAGAIIIGILNWVIGDPPRVRDAPRSRA